ncbi:MAG: phosphoribosylformylglycinamidine synthase, partial [Paraclostridium sp.]
MMSITNLASSVRRILVEKKQGFDLEAKHLKFDLEESLNIDTIENLRILNRYDIEKIEDEVYEKAINTVFSEPNTDDVYKEYVELSKEDRVFAIEYLPGQYDQRGDWASQCIQIINEGIRPIINTAKVVILTGNITDEQFKQIKSYCINPVDSREAILEKPETLEVDTEIPTSVDILEEFINLEENQLKDLMKALGLAMTFDDLLHVQKYFKQIENRNPTITEIKVLDTYWSDHCRHTTFMTKIEDIVIEESKYTNVVKEAYDLYLQSRKNVYG